MFTGIAVVVIVAVLVFVAWRRAKVNKTLPPQVPGDGGSSRATPTIKQK